MYDMLDSWAKAWGVPQAAVDALLMEMTSTLPCEDEAVKTEADAQNRVRILASKNKCRLWRNNVGACATDSGGFIRFGLANDTPAVNRKLKSCDLIGIRHDGVFMAREIKHPGWKYKGTEREQAQLAFITLVNSFGGDARFSTGEL